MFEPRTAIAEPTGKMCGGGPTNPTAIHAIMQDSEATAEQLRTLPSLNALFAHRVLHMSDDVFLCVPKATSTAPGAIFEYNKYTYGQLDFLVRQLAAIYAHALPPKTRTSPTRVVALLASSGFDYAVNCMAINRLGHTVAYLSTNNSCAALAHLVQATSAHMVLYGPDQETVVADLKSLLARQGLDSVHLMPWTTAPKAAEGSPANNVDSSAYTTSLTYEEQGSEIVTIIHSSGSTGFPKPSMIDNRRAIGKINSMSALDSFATVPLFHMYGHGAMWQTVLVGKRLYMYNGRLTADLLARAIQASTAEQFCAVPFVLKLLSESDRGLCALSQFKLVLSGGSPCPSEVGNKLVQRYKVPLVSGYGSTEAGGLMFSARDFANDQAWEWLRPHPAFIPHMQLENIGDDASGPFELIAGAGWSGLTETNRPDGSYATKDLFAPHATRPHLYKYVGRRDDTLVHYNGEKTNPVPMELEIRSSPYVAECLIFGAGRPQAGVLIVPSDLALREISAAVSESDVNQEEAKDRKLNALIWKAVQGGNAEAPSHSQIVPELVKVLPADTKFSSADKGSLIRNKVIEAFKQEIDEVYQAYEAGSSSIVKVKLQDEESCVKMVAQVVSEVSGHAAADLTTTLENADLIELGIDSLRANRIRNMLQQQVVLSSTLPSNLVFEYPTVQKLAQRLLDSSRGDSSSQQNLEETEIEKTKALLKELEGQIQVRSKELDHGLPPNGPTNHTIVLTGSTGSLGAHILSQLAILPVVKTIICLNRAKNDEVAKSRTDESLLIRGLDGIDKLAASTDTLILCLASALDKPKLGLTSDVWERLLNTTTCVIHNGWPVNFNMLVQSFRAPLLGTVNLINLATQTRGTATPSFIYSSSVSAALGSPSRVVKEEFSSDARNTANMGYGRSKWIVENLCAYAQKHVEGQFDAVVARIGQMVGDRRSGVWNETEAWPLMLKSAQTVGCLPRLDLQVSWQPVDESGFIMAGLVLPRRFDGVVHIVNPAMTPFSEILKHLAASQNLGPSFEVVEPNEWVRRLSESDSDLERNPTKKLLDFYMGMYGSKPELEVEPEAEVAIRKSGKILATDRLVSVFEDLKLSNELQAMLVPVDGELMTKFIDAWRRTGFLE